MRKGTIAGALTLAAVSFSFVSAETIKNGGGLPLPTAFVQPAGTGSGSSPAGARASVSPRSEKRVAALEPGKEISAPAASAAREAGPVAESNALPDATSASKPAAASSSQGARSLALVIGNAEYPDAEAPLSHALADAHALADELRGRGFEVVLGENLTKQGMERAIASFQAKITPGSTALLYFSGYGVQTGRESYLVPVNSQIWRPEDVRRDGIGLESLVTEMNARGATRKLLILDASRRNPFERRLRGFSAGLAPITSPEGTLILYGAAPGKVANDTAGEHSLLTTELLQQIRSPGLTIEEAFNRTRVNVARASNGEQVPAVFSALLEDFHLGAPNPSATRQSAR